MSQFSYRFVLIMWHAFVFSSTVFSTCFKAGEKFIKEEEDEDFVQLFPCEEYDTVQSNGHTSVVKEHQLELNLVPVKTHAGT